MSSNHKQRYKNSALDSKELRRRREEEGLQLRKQKREQQLFKKRNVNLPAGGEEGELGPEVKAKDSTLKAVYQFNY